MPLTTADIEDMNHLVDIKAMEFNMRKFLSSVPMQCSTPLFTVDPTLHPAWNADLPPSILAIYDARIYPNHGNVTNTFIDFTSPIGKAIRELNSTGGVPTKTHGDLVQATRLCTCCLNHFSPAGYDSHLMNGHCTNHPKRLTGMFSRAIAFRH